MNRFISIGITAFGILLLLSNHSFLPIFAKGKKNPDPERFFSSEFGANLYLFPDIRRGKVSTLPIASILKKSVSPSEIPGKEWMFVETENEVSGFIKKAETIPWGARPVLALDKIYKKHSLRTAMTLEARMELAESLFEHSEQGTFWAEDYLLVRAHAGFALKQAIDTMNREKIKPNHSTRVKDFLRKFQSTLLFDYESGEFYMDSAYFWKLIEKSPGTKYADELGYMATESLPQKECKKDFYCELESLRKGKLRFIYFFPESSYSKKYFTSIKTQFEVWGSESDSLPCYDPISQELVSEIRIITKYIESFPKVYQKALQPHWHLVQRECLKE